MDRTYKEGNSLVSLDPSLTELDNNDSIERAQTTFIPQAMQETSSAESLTLFGKQA